MAAPTCTVCNANQAILLVSSLEDGETTALCTTDMPAFFIGMALGFTSDLTPDAAEAYGQAFDQFARNDTRAKPAKRPAKRSAQRAVPAVPEAALAPPLPGGDAPDDVTTCRGCLVRYQGDDITEHWHQSPECEKAEERAGLAQADGMTDANDRGAFDAAHGHG